MNAFLSRHLLIIFGLILASRIGFSQTVKYRPLVEAYYRLDAFSPQNLSAEPLLFVANVPNTLQVNLAAVQMEANGERWRVNFTPAFGTFMKYNFAAEPAEFRNLLEASGGIKLSKEKAVWLDAGILGSPFGFEGAFSALNPQVSRSFSAENSPYVLSGARISFPFGGKGTGAFYVANGWQNIQETNAGKALAFQYQHTDGPWLVNFSTYAGDETGAGSNERTYRLFQDVYVVRQGEKGWKWIALADAGIQTGSQPWFTANLTAAKNWGKWCAAGRAEYFSDVDRVIVSPVSGNAVRVWGGSLNVDWVPVEAARLRLEARYLQNEAAIFSDGNQGYRKDALFATLSLVLFPDYL